MTTVVVDIQNKKAYSDSRFTSTNTKTGDNTYTKTKDKIMKHKNGESLCALSGNVALIRSKLKSSGFNKAFKNSIGCYKSGDSCCIIILQKASKLATVVIGVVVGDTVKWEYRTYNDQYIYVGSGSVTKEAKKISRYIESGIKIPFASIIKAASFTDNYTDNDIRKVVL